MSRDGHRVLEAANGAEALTVWAEHKFEIDCLVTDIEMPRLTGLALADLIVSESPQTAVLVMSAGYTPPACDYPFIRKPFAPSEFSRLVREIMSRPRRKPAASEPGSDAGGACQSA